MVREAGEFAERTEACQPAVEEERGLETEKELKDAEEAIAPALEGAAGVKDIKQWLWVCRQKLVVLDLFCDLEKPQAARTGKAGTARRKRRKRKRTRTRGSGGWSGEVSLPVRPTVCLNCPRH